MNQKKKSLDKNEIGNYKEYFGNCKKELHDTLEIIDTKYSLYDERWLALLSILDYENMNYHSIQGIGDLQDEEIVDILLNRATKFEQEFSDKLSGLCTSINTTSNIKSLSEALHIVQHFHYPINMMKRYNKQEQEKTDKVILMIGPIKTKERALQKVSETTDKKVALLDSLRATILCGDPVVVISIINYLKETDKSLTRIKNKSAPDEPYKCMHLNFSIGSGDERTIVELQILLKEYYELQKYEHKFYEVLRVL